MRLASARNRAGGRVSRARASVGVCSCVGRAFVRRWMRLRVGAWVVHLPVDGCVGGWVRAWVRLTRHFMALGTAWSVRALHGACVGVLACVLAWVRLTRHFMALQNSMLSTPPDLSWSSACSGIVLIYRSRCRHSHAHAHAHACMTCPGPAPGAALFLYIGLDVDTHTRIRTLIHRNGNR